MKKIKVKAHLHIPSLTKRRVDVPKLEQMFYDAQDVRDAVLLGAMNFEAALETIIVSFFFPGSSEKRTAFQSVVLGSDWCTFNSKRKLVEHVLDKTKALSDIENKEFKNLMRKIIDHRNSFTHGRFWFDENDQILLRYFKETQKDQPLTDEYLTQIESVLQRGNDMAFELGFLFANQPQEKD